MLPSDTDIKKLGNTNENEEKGKDETKCVGKEQMPGGSKEGCSFLDPVVTKDAADKPSSVNGVVGMNLDEISAEQKALERKYLKDAEVLFDSKCKLYRMKENEWCQRGEGKIYILKQSSSELYKVVMVREKVWRLGCNHYVDPKFDLVPHRSKNSWIWSTLGDTCKGDIKSDSSQSFVASFQNNETFKKFEEVYNSAKEKNCKYISSGADEKQ
jgi:Ran-binding protein 1